MWVRAVTLLYDSYLLASDSIIMTLAAPGSLHSIIHSIIHLSSRSADDRADYVDKNNEGAKYLLDLIVLEPRRMKLR